MVKQGLKNERKLEVKLLSETYSVPMLIPTEEEKEEYERIHGYIARAAKEAQFAEDPALQTNLIIAVAAEGLARTTALNHYSVLGIDAGAKELSAELILEKINDPENSEEKIVEVDDQAIDELFKEAHRLAGEILEREYGKQRGTE